MSSSKNWDNPELEKLPEILSSLEQRIKRIEAKLGIEATETQLLSLNIASDANLKDTESESNQEGDSFFESSIVEYGLGWFGSIVLLFGITFLMTYTHNSGNVLLSTFIGYASVAGIFTISYYLRNSFPHLVYMLNISAFLLLYYVTLLLHYFSPNPLISNQIFALILLVAVIGSQIYFAVQRNSEFIASLGIVLLIVSALFTDTTHLMLPLIALTAATSLYLLIRYSWWRLLIFSIFLVYAGHLLWLMNNPLMGHPAQAVDSHQYNLFYLFSYSAIYSMVTLIKQKGKFPDNIYISSVLLNGMGFSFILLLVVMTFFKENYIILFLAISAFCLFYSIILKTQTERPFAPSFYASFSFMTLSVAVYGFAKLPDAYFYLVLESLYVVSMALWFRTRIIVFMNTLLFLGIFMLYLITAPSTDLINFTFAIVALLTARILNWQKERLTLKTELLRNVYLISAFVMVLFSLYKAMPSQYVTVSWSGAAALFFILSILFHNVKYRWMAIVTILVTGFYLFIVDLKHMEVGYRVVAFLFFAIISFSASLYYTKRIKKKASSPSIQEKVND